MSRTESPEAAVLREAEEVEANHAARVERVERQLSFVRERLARISDEERWMTAALQAEMAEHERAKNRLAAVRAAQAEEEKRTRGREG